MLVDAVKECLQSCTSLQQLTLSVGEYSATQELLGVKDEHLQLNSVSAESFTMFLKLKPELLKQVGFTRVCKVSACTKTTPAKKQEGMTPPLPDRN